MKRHDFDYNVEMRLNGSQLAYETLDWTTEPPTREGWYWAKVIDAENPAWAGKVDLLMVIVLDDGPQYTLRNGFEATHWLGPLLVPAPPKE